MILRILTLRLLSLEKTCFEIKDLEKQSSKGQSIFFIGWSVMTRTTPDSKKGRVHQLDWIVWQSWYQWPDAIAESISDSPVRKRTSAKTESCLPPPSDWVGQSWKVNSIMSCCCRGRLNKAMASFSPLASRQLTHSHTRIQSVSQCVILSRGPKSFLGDWQKASL